jgi:hypothetical protein
MKAVDVIRSAFGFSELTFGSIADMKQNPLCRPGPFGGNHALWIAGHLAVTEGRLHKILWGEPNPVEHWKPLFDWGSTPTDNLSAYPPFDEVVGTFQSLRKETLEFLDRCGDEGLDRPTKLPPPGLEAPFATVGQAMATIAYHQMFHNGEGAVSRRASGKTPFFIPSEAQFAF